MIANQDLITGTDGKKRCKWCGDDPLYIQYHDEEWGRPVHDDTRLFEKLCLEGFQAGLSWITILRKRENFRAAFEGFNIDKVAIYDNSDVERLLNDPGIIRHRGKIEATINNAKRAQELIEEQGNLDTYFWSYAQQTRTTPQTMQDIPSKTEVSQALSKDLKKRGWRFVGPTTCYAFMQAMGLINDHLENCHAQHTGGETND